MQQCIDNETTFIAIKKLRFYTKPKVRTHHLFGNAYYVDSKGNVYTNNRKTYFTKFGDFLRKSNGNTRVVTLRDVEGVKVSIARKTLVKILFN